MQGDPRKSPHKAAESDPKSVVILGPCGKEAGGFWRILRWALRGYDGNCLILTDAVPRAPDGIQWQQSRLLLFRCDEASLILADRAFESGALVAVVGGEGIDRRFIPLPKDRATIRAFIHGKPRPLDSVLRERLARAIHENYVAMKRAAGAGDDASLMPWDSLDDGLKESNRAQADAIPSKLRVLGLCVVEPGSEKKGVWLRELSSARVEVLAEIEHGRWVLERLMAGWRLGPRDLEARRSPYLVSWADLADEVRELDRNAVRQIPLLLRVAGIRVARCKERK